MSEFFAELSKDQDVPIQTAEAAQAQDRREMPAAEDERIRAWLNRFDDTIANMERIDFLTTVLVETRIISA
jgi:hypothetical protein